MRLVRDSKIVQLPCKNSPVFKLNTHYVFASPVFNTSISSKVTWNSKRKDDLEVHVPNRKFKMNTKFAIHL